ncbi:MAG: YaiO family outer membrane beta-barrel protein [Bacteroidota bacterium]
MKILKVILIVCTSIGIVANNGNVHAQSWGHLDSDELFQLARQKAFNGNREESRAMLRHILRKSPGYHDVRILLGRTYAWDGKRDSARMELQIVLKESPQHEDALSAMTDVEMWDEQYQQALAVVQRGLQAYPSAENFLYKKASILYNLNSQDEALKTLEQLLSINPSHEQGSRLLKKIDDGRRKFTSGATYGIDLFSRTFDPAHYALAQIGRTNAWGTSIVRMNYAYRFAIHGLQGEIDLYPGLFKGVYAYLNYGYADSRLFPRHRVGAEIFTKLPRSFEASAGVRYLYYSEQTKVYIITGALGWYVRSYWLSLRPYFTPDKLLGNSFSASLTLRRYFEDRDNFIGCVVGMGFSPDERRIQSGAGLTDREIYVLKSQRGEILWSKTLWHHVTITLSLNVSRQELIFDEGAYVYITSLNAGLRKRF